MKPIEYKTRQNLYRGGVPKKSFQNFLFIQETFVSLLKQYKMNNKELIGKRIRIIEMIDPQPVPSGTMGTIAHVDGLGQLHVKWDNGRSLAVIPEEDKYEILN